MKLSIIVNTSMSYPDMLFFLGGGGGGTKAILKGLTLTKISVFICIMCVLFCICLWIDFVDLTWERMLDMTRLWPSSAVDRMLKIKSSYQLVQGVTVAERTPFYVSLNEFCSSGIVLLYYNAFLYYNLNDLRSPPPPPPPPKPCSSIIHAVAVWKMIITLKYLSRNRVYIIFKHILHHHCRRAGLA